MSSCVVSFYDCSLSRLHIEGISVWLLMPPCRHVKEEEKQRVKIIVPLLFQKLFIQEFLRGSGQPVGSFHLVGCG